jgi:NitT/TauT family transport system ATP-binding protein
VSLEIGKGEIVSFFGPNGCGKSTLMNIIAGIDSPDKGRVAFHDEPSIGYIFQDFRESLLPWKTVLENIAFPLLSRKMSKRKAYRIARKLVLKSKIDIDLNAYPFMLSGGQAQMVGILRALTTKPGILIFDEPFSAMDYINHLDLIMKIGELHEKNRFTALFVSHDIDDAILLSDKIVVLSNKPTKILKVINCSLPKPRKIDLMTSDKFSRIKSKVLKLIKTNIIETKCP